MNVRTLVAVSALVLILFAVNASIWNKEQHLEHGTTVLLELAPVDPRSLMQGDYMALNFAVSNELRAALPKQAGGRGRWWSKVDAEDGWVKLSLDENGVGQFVGVASEATSTDGTLHVAFRVRNGRVKFATNAYFFQEGTASVYEQARYGEFRINHNGEPLLTAMRDESYQLLAPEVDAER